jgi:predicted RNA-binding Zn ribbon-like protein
MGDGAQFLAGAWSLDFANTVEPRTAEGRDYVPDFNALIHWSRQAGLLTAKDVSALRRRATARDAAAVHERAVQLREVMYRVFQAIATGQSPDGQDLAALRDAQAEAIAHATPQWEDGLRWTWPSDVERPGWMLADDAVRLLESPRVDRVKICRPSCSWLFLDLTRNGSRRWCSTTDCGLREKIRRQADRRARQSSARTAGHS